MYPTLCFLHHSSAHMNLINLQLTRRAVYSSGSLERCLNFFFFFDSWDIEKNSTALCITSSFILMSSKMWAENNVTTTDGSKHVDFMMLMLWSLTNILTWPQNFCSTGCNLYFKTKSGLQSIIYELDAWQTEVCKSTQLNLVFLENP